MPLILRLALSAPAPAPSSPSYIRFPLFPALSRLVCTRSAAELTPSTDFPARSAACKTRLMLDTKPADTNSNVALNFAIYFFAPFAARFSASTRISQLAAIKAFSRTVMLASWSGRICNFCNAKCASKNSGSLCFIRFLRHFLKSQNLYPHRTDSEQPQPRYHTHLRKASSLTAWLLPEHRMLSAVRRSLNLEIPRPPP